MGDNSDNAGKNKDKLVFQSPKQKTSKYNTKKQKVKAKIKAKAQDNFIDDIDAALREIEAMEKASITKVSAAANTTSVINGKQQGINRPGKNNGKHLSNPDRIPEGTMENKMDKSTNNNTKSSLKIKKSSVKVEEKDNADETRILNTISANKCSSAPGIDANKCSNAANISSVDGAKICSAAAQTNVQGSCLKEAKNKQCIPASNREGSDVMEIVEEEVPRKDRRKRKTTRKNATKG